MLSIIRHSLEPITVDLNWERGRFVSFGVLTAAGGRRGSAEYLHYEQSAFHGLNDPRQTSHSMPQGRKEH